jgi:Domain of unknown function (DUF4397)
VRHARIFRPALAGAALLLASLGLVAVQPMSASAQGSDARVRVAHFSADAPPVDVYVDGKPKLRNVPFQAMSDYLTLAAGAHTFDVRAAGAAATAAPAVSVSQDFVAGKSYTVAAVGPIASISGKVYEDNVTVPATGKARIRVIHATPSAPSVDVAVKGGAVLFPKLEFGTSSTYTEVAAGSYEIEVREAGKTEALLTKPVTLQGGGVYTIAAVPAANGGPNLRGFIDVAPSAAPPPATEVVAAVTTTTTAAAPTTKAAATETSAAPTTKAAPAADTEPVADTEVADTEPTTDTEVAADTEVVADTEVAAADTEVAADTEAAGAVTTKPAPTGGVDTGFGGLTDDKGSPTPVAALMAIIAAAVGGGLLRRRRIRG